MVHFRREISAHILVLRSMLKHRARCVRPSGLRFEGKSIVVSHREKFDALSSAIRVECSEESVTPFPNHPYRTSQTLDVLAQVTRYRAYQDSG